MHSAYSRAPASLLSLALAALSACASSPDSSAASDASASSETSSAVDASDARGAATDAAHAACGAADFAASDHTADADPRVVRAPDGPAPAQFDPSCMRVKTGQTVTWRGDLAAHPIAFVFTPAIGGDAGSAGPDIVVGDSDGGLTTDTVTTRVAGVLQFECIEHPGVMFGAVQIVD